MSRIYLDNNILIPLVVSDPSLTDRKAVVEAALRALSQTEVQLCVSGWTLTEMVKVMINEYGIKPKKCAEMNNHIAQTQTVGGFEVEIISPSVRDDFSVTDLFNQVREVMTNYSPGWGDAIHCVIMRENNIRKILSTDGKDFQVVGGIEVIHPGSLKIE